MQSGSTAKNSRSPASLIGARLFRELYAQRLVKVLFKRGVVGLHAAMFALKSTRWSIDSHRPLRVRTLFATATWVCNPVPARLSRWVNVSKPGDANDLPHPMWTGPGRRACPRMSAKASFTAA